jgi:hypothetical protein
MSGPAPSQLDWQFDPAINLGARDPRLKDRQTRTSLEILRRFRDQPGVLLADEVGLGKTFVALACAASVLRSDSYRRPVLVVTRSREVIDKWMNDWEDFAAWCLTTPESGQIRPLRIHRPEDLLQAVGSRDSSRPNLLFTTSGALSSDLGNRWVKLAIAARAMRGLKGADWAARRSSLPQRGWRLFGCTWQHAEGLLHLPLRDWPTEAHAAGLDDADALGTVAAALDSEDIDLSEVRTALGDHLPTHHRPLTPQQLTRVKTALRAAFAEVWPRVLAAVDGSVDLSLLILDEAHNVKNARTAASRLITEHPLVRGSADRMLFMTATPFALRHGELIDVLRHFDHVKADLANPSLHNELDELKEALDRYQVVFGAFSRSWGRLGRDDLPSDGAWWLHPTSVPGIERTLPDLLREVKVAADKLRPWVIRHVEERHRVVVRGKDVPAAVDVDDPATSAEDVGIAIDEAAALPFLLAAQADAVLRLSGLGRSEGAARLFTAGLDSSFEAFQRRSAPEGDEGAEVVAGDDDGRVRRYRKEISALLRPDGGLHRDTHPKVRATADLCAAKWWRKEKVLVFVTYVASRKALERAITERIAAHISAELVRNGHPNDALTQRGGNPARTSGTVEQAIRATASRLAAEAEVPAEHHPQLEGVLLRFFRSPSWAVRFVDLGQRKLRDAYLSPLTEGTPHHDDLRTYLRRYLERLGQDARIIDGSVAGHRTQQHLQDLQRIATGWKVISDPVDGEKARISPAVAQVSTGTGEKRRVIAGFNSPFFPDIVLTGQILEEGVDLHRECRVVVHHDLDWNPGRVEQRTGRVDRVGSKAAELGLSIEVHLPYIAGTQDERRYRVVMDRANWFHEVLDGGRRSGEADEGESARLALPEGLAEQLRIDLSLADQGQTPP